MFLNDKAWARGGLGVTGEGGTFEETAAVYAAKFKPKPKKPKK